MPCYPSPPSRHSALPSCSPKLCFVVVCFAEKRMPKVQVVCCRHEVSDATYYIARCQPGKPIKRGETVGLLAGRVLGPDDPVRDVRCTYIPLGTKIKGIEAENECKYFADGADVNCKFQMCHDVYGRMYFEVVALQDISSKTALSMHRRA